MDFAVLASRVISSHNCKMAMFEVLHCLNLWGFLLQILVVLTHLVICKNKQANRQKKKKTLKKLLRTIVYSDVTFNIEKIESVRAKKKKEME